MTPRSLAPALAAATLLVIGSGSTAAASSPAPPPEGMAADAGERSAVDLATVDRLVEAADVEGLRRLGPAVMAPLSELYAAADTSRRAAIAGLFYRLGWESKDAERVLLADLGTLDPHLRLQVQWALGRVSGDRLVVRRLLAIMRNDPNALFRDKAACALASDQIHLDERQRLELLAGLVAALEDDEPQVRRIAAKALKIQTGQRKGYSADAPPEVRAAAVARWQTWLAEYAAQGVP